MESVFESKRKQVSLTTVAVTPQGPINLHLYCHTETIAISKTTKTSVCKLKDPSKKQSLGAQETIIVKSHKHRHRDDSTPCALKSEFDKLMLFEGNENIVQAYDFIETSQKSHLVLEKCATDCTVYFNNLRTAGQLSLCYIKKFCNDALQGLSAIHALNMVHTDFKCQNVFVKLGPDSEPSFKIGGFGAMMKIEDSSDAILVKNISGFTPSKCAPEIAKYYDNFEESESETSLDTLKFDSKCDIWSFGACLFEVIFGEFAFGAINAKKKKIDAAKTYSNIIRKHFAIDGWESRVEARIWMDDFEKEQLLDLMHKCFIMDAKQRPSAQDLLLHPFLSKHADEVTSLSEDIDSDDDWLFVC